MKLDIAFTSADGIARRLRLRAIPGLDGSRLTDAGASDDDGAGASNTTVMLLSKHLIWTAEWWLEIEKMWIARRTLFRSKFEVRAFCRPN